MTSSLSQAATRDQLKTPNFIPSNSSAQASVSSKIKDSEQRPPRKRQKILPSSPFRFESPQPCNSQSSKAASMEQTVTDKSPAPRSIQGMEAEWPKRGRTNTRGRAPLAAPEYSTPRSQNENISGLSKSCSRARSVSLDTAKRLLRTAGMILPYDDLHRFPSNMDPYLECLREMPNQATPLTLKV